MEPWPRKELPPGVIDDLIDNLEKRIDEHFSVEVDSFLRSYPVDKWVIASDYSMGCPEYSHDAMAFALVPFMKGMLPADIDKALPYDLKKCKKIVSQNHIDYLRNASTLSFVFLLDRKNMVFSDAEQVVRALENSLIMMRAWPNAQAPQIQETIKKTELCLSESKKKSFLRKANQVTMLAALGAFVGLISRRNKQLQGVLWAPDRDPVNHIWDSYSNDLFFTNLHSALHRRKLPENYISGIADNRVQGKLWSDAYIRLADFLATPAAAMTRTNKQPDERYKKFDQVVKEVFADNPRLIFHEVAIESLPSDKARIHLHGRRFSKTPFVQ